MTDAVREAESSRSAVETVIDAKLAPLQQEVREAKGRLMTVAIQRSRQQRRPGANSGPVPFCRRPVSGPEWVRFREQIAEGCVWPDLFGAAGPLSCSSHRKSKPKSEMTDEEFAAALARMPVLTIEVVRLPGWEGATPTI